MQGGVCELPIADFPTGVMRGRFHADGALYACGMVGWASSCRQEGGFYRLRYTGKAASLPLAVHAAKDKLTVTFSDPLDPASVKPDAFAFKVWSLKRSANYGSNHVAEHTVPVAAASVSADGRTVTLDIPALPVTQCYELAVKVNATDGTPVMRSLHGTIHSL